MVHLARWGCPVPLGVYFGINVSINFLLLGFEDFSGSMVERLLGMTVTVGGGLVGLEDTAVVWLVRGVGNTTTRFCRVVGCAARTFFEVVGTMERFFPFGVAVLLLACVITSSAQRS